MTAFRPTLVWDVIEQRGRHEEVVAGLVDHTMAQDLAARLRKQYPKNGYDVRQAPKKLKRDMAPGEWAAKRRR